MPKQSKTPPVQTLDETKIALEDIRKKLNDFPDTSLALQILDNLSILENQLEDKTTIIAEIEAERAGLITANSELFARVTAGTTPPVENRGVNYEDIERNLNTIIDDI